MSPSSQSQIKHTADGSFDVYALDTLRHNGFRITAPRKYIVQLLAQTEVPLSAYEIRDALQEDGKKADVVSIYRVLDCLESNHLLHRLMGSGKVVRCQLPSEAHCTHSGHYHCHHILVCQQCDKVSEVHCAGVETMIETLENQTQFEIRHHALEFTGVCATCQNP